jgi:two-component system, OmpR family, KDP operon response regulator KdpE
VACTRCRLYTPHEALGYVEFRRPDLIVAVLEGPARAADVLQCVRDHGLVPVIFVGTRERYQEMVASLVAGADDFLLAPFAPDELHARIVSVLQRRRLASTVRPSPRVQLGSLAMDFDRYETRISGQLVDLTRREWLLLGQLAGNAGKTMLATELLAAVWGAAYRDDLHYLRLLVHRLRSKLGVAGAMVQTVRGVGYRMEHDPTTASGSVRHHPAGVRHAARRKQQGHLAEAGAGVASALSA